MQTGKSRSLGGNAPDGINAQGRKTYWNAQFEVDEDDETLVNIVAMRDIAAGELVVVWYGAEYWCDDRHKFSLKLMAIKTYNIDIFSDTSKDGDWRGLKHFKALRWRLWNDQWTAPEKSLKLPSRKWEVMPMPPEVIVVVEPVEEQLIISACNMDIQTRPTSKDEWYKAMCDMGANVNVGPVRLAKMLELPIIPHVDGRRIGTADAAGSMDIVGWIFPRGYTGPIALVKRAAWTLLSIMQIQQNGMGCHCSPETYMSNHSDGKRHRGGIHGIATERTDQPLFHRHQETHAGQFGVRSTTRRCQRARSCVIWMHGGAEQRHGAVHSSTGGRGR
jgi:hypothetical protein